MGKGDLAGMPGEVEERREAGRVRGSRSFGWLARASTGVVIVATGGP